jgi:hypothetical protein
VLSELEQIDHVSIFFLRGARGIIDVHNLRVQPKNVHPPPVDARIALARQHVEVACCPDASVEVAAKNELGDDPGPTDAFNYLSPICSSFIYANRAAGSGSWEADSR